MALRPRASASEAVPSAVPGMTLCAACTAIRIHALAAELQDAPSWLPAPKGTTTVTGLRHLSDARQLPDSAATCSFCALITASILQKYCSHLTSDEPLAWDAAELRSRLLGGPIYLQLRKDGAGRIARERPNAESELHGKAVAVYVQSVDGVLKGRIRLFAQPGMTRAQRPGSRPATLLNAVLDSPASTSGDVVCVPPLSSSNCPEAFRLIREWLVTCVKFHPKCRQTLSKTTIDETAEPVLPTRVIDVAPSDGSADVRLLEPMGSRGRYVTLSHCWGPSHRHPLTTITATLPQRLAEIRWDLLPKTFKDAITIVRTLGYRYIWIDSLCIVQNDEQEWIRESALMGVIYERAELTIAACHARDSTEGCFFQRTPAAHPAVALPYWNTNGEQHGEFYGTLLPNDYHPISPEFSPLSERGWATQEWLLSRRVIFFTQERLVWSCRSRTQRETRESFHDPARNTHWKIIVEKYSARKLTKPRDRLVALQGLINEMQRANGDRCAFGVWAGKLADELLWFCLRPAERDDSRNAFPTWSWASTCHGVRFQKIDKAKKMWRRLCVADDSRALEAIGLVKKLSHFTLLSEVTPPPAARQDSGFSSVSHDQDGPDPRLTSILSSIKGNLHETFWPLSFDKTEQPPGWELTYLIHDDEQQPIGWASLDEGTIPDREVFSLAVSGKEDSHSSKDFYHYWILLLERREADEGSDVYRRIGVGKIECKAWYADADTRYLRIK